MHMDTDVDFRGFRRARPPSIERAAADLLALSGDLKACLRTGAKWTTLDAAFERQPVRDACDIEIALYTSAPLRPVEIEPDAPTYAATMFASTATKKRAEDLFRLHVGFCLPDEGARKPDLHLAATVKRGASATERATSASVREILTIVARKLELDWLMADSPKGRRPRRAGRTPRVGWFTYLSRSLGALPSIPPPTEVIPVDDLGWILVAQPEPVDESNPEHQASLAYVRHALGGRVLLDGPSFPPPGTVGMVVIPEPAPPVALPEVPSYLKAPPAAASPQAATLPADPTTAPAVQAAMPTETGAIDLSRLFKAPLPFDPNARDAAVVAERAPSHVLPAATGTSEVVVSKLVQPSTPFDDSTSRSAPGAASARSGAQLSTETTEIQIGALLRQAVPFDPHAKPGDEPVRAAATPSAPSGPAAPSPDRPALKTASAAFTETEELNLKDLFKRGPAVPFGAPAPVPGTAELPTVVSSPAAPGAAPAPAAPAPTGRGRWIRFDTQTGEPLATPYWEALPQPEKK